MIQELSRCRASCRVLLKTALDETLYIGSVAFELDERCKVKLTAANFIECLESISSNEGRLAHHDIVGNHAKRPNVNLKTVLLVFGQLWSHVQRSAKRHGLFLLGIDSLCKPEVGNFTDQAGSVILFVSL